MKKQILGIDVGSTTIKLVSIIDEEVVYKKYKRHHSKINETLVELLSEFVKQNDDNEDIVVNITGSAGLGLSRKYGLNFVQEVSCAYYAVNKLYPDIDVIIELGGEDAKLIFIDNGNVEQRMNGTCAGGTGAFIDQMAGLLKVEVNELNELAKNYSKIYDISSRCGVFAKNDIQPLLNQGASKEDIAVSIYQAIVNQTIIGLAQGKKIEGKVCFLGGPLTFSEQLRQRFIETLDLKDSFIPDNAELFVAYGCAIYPTDKTVDLNTLIDRLTNDTNVESNKYLKPLFKDENEYSKFIERHDMHKVDTIDISTYEGNAYLGIDAGSTTTKVALISEDDKILYSFYSNNEGNPLDIVKQALVEMISQMNDKIEIKGAYSTGYGEQLIKNSFNLDGGQVETICHFEAAKHFLPDVEFVLDIGGQDMKYFTVENGVITTIVLNEACSSGCGSFISTYATSLGYEIQDFAKIALFAKKPLDLGTRCTVFMNSGIKQALAMQVDVKDISASLAISVVKNALYKVIRATNFQEEFGTKVVVQGGTFYNDAILKAFEDEAGIEVIRPNISGIMGAFGAALIAKSQNLEKTRMLSYDEIINFSYEATNVTCQLCSNRCSLTVNNFGGNRKFIANNRCSKPLKKEKSQYRLANMYAYKLDLLDEFINTQETFPKKISVIKALNMYENIPFWIGFFNYLNIEVEVSNTTSNNQIRKGQDTIPSDTVCYPAKIVHGHIVELDENHCGHIFYPNMPYNEMDSLTLSNHYNCPVVGCYPELINGNIDLKNSKLLMPYLSLENEKEFVNVMHKTLHGFSNSSKASILEAYHAGKRNLNSYRQQVLDEGQEQLKYALDNNLKVIVLAGRPYHIDPMINHGIDQLINDLGCVVLSEDSFKLDSSYNSNVLNQWTYHNRMYNAAHKITNYDNVNLVQLVSFGCGIDSITSDEVRRILEKNNKLYTQIKIDDISNIGSANIRLRSLINIMK